MISLPVMRIFKDSFSHVMEHKLGWVKIITLPFFIEIIANLSMGAGDILIEQSENSHIISAVLFYLISIILSILAGVGFYLNGYRFGILNEGGVRWLYFPINKRFVTMILYGFLILSFFIGFFLVIAGFFLLGDVFPSSLWISVPLMFLLSFYACYAWFRLSLLFPLIAIDGVNPMRTSWQMVKGSVLRILGLTLLISLAILCIIILGAFGIGLIGMILYFVSPPVGISFGLLLGVPFIISLWILYWSVYLKAQSLVYLSLSADKA